MIIVPGTPPLEETRHSRELSRRIDQVVRDYRRDNPEATSSDVRTALVQLTPGGDSLVSSRRKNAIAVAIGAISVGVFTFLASTGGKGFTGSSQTWLVIGVTAAVAGVVVAVIRTIRG